MGHRHLLFASLVACAAQAQAVEIVHSRSATYSGLDPVRIIVTGFVQPVVTPAFRDMILEIAATTTIHVVDLGPQGSDRYWNDVPWGGVWGGFHRIDFDNAWMSVRHNAGTPVAPETLTFTERYRYKIHAPHAQNDAYYLARHGINVGSTNWAGSEGMQVISRTKTVTGTVRYIYDAVPEPATWAQLIVGLGGIGAARRRATAVRRSPVASRP